MNNKKIITAIVLTAAVITLVAIVAVVMKQAGDRANQKVQKKEAVSEETLRKEGERSLEMIKKGYVKMLSGEVVKVDNGAKNFVIDIDPLGKHKEYTVYIDKETKFSILTYTYPASANEDVAEFDNDEEINVSEKYSPADFSNIAKSSPVNVTLNKWAENIDGNSQRLVAEKVDIIVE